MVYVMFNLSSCASSLTDADLHLFSPSQPDLNWDNPEVRDAVYDVIDFWGKKGTDGFRVSSHRMLVSHVADFQARCHQLGVQNPRSSRRAHHRAG